MNYIRLPYDTPLRLLPLAYFLPRESQSQTPTLRTLPRCFHEVMTSEKHIDTIKSDQFLNEVMTATAELVFPHFGLRGWVEHYTGYCPAWELAYAVSLWAKTLEEEIGWGLYNISKLPKECQIPFFDTDYIKEVMGFVAKRGIEKENLQPILDLVKEIPCHEDFMPYDTFVSIDFKRKWYHTRSIRVQTISLEACLKDEDHSIHEVATDSADMNNVESMDFVERFKVRLSEKDRTILEFRELGYTYEEIASKLDYKNHSGVIKRMRAIKSEFIKYQDEQ